MSPQQTGDIRYILARLSDLAHSSYDAGDEAAMDLVLKMSKDIRDFLKDRFEAPKPPPRAKLEVVKD